MRQKKSSIVLQTLKNQRNLIQSADSTNSIFSYINTNEIPSVIEQKITAVNCKDKKIIKVGMSPHGFIVSFYLSFLKLLFVNRTAFQKCVQKLLEILDEDEFTIHAVKDKRSPFYLDWSNSKIKRMTSEYFKQILVEEYQNVDQILGRNPDFNKILFLVSWSLLYDSQRVSNFDEAVEFDTVKEVLFHYFGIEAYQNEDSIFISDCNILIECFDDSDIYIIHLPNFEEELDENTSQSIQINYAMNGEDMASELKIDLNQNVFVEDEQNMAKTRDFRQLTTRTCQNNQNMHKTLKFRQLRFNTEQERHSITSRDYSIDRSNHHSRHRISFFKAQNQNSRPHSRAVQSKFKIERLFQMAGHKTATQKSLYDEAPLSDADQYSVLDISIPTSKKINEKSFNKENQEITDMAESLKPRNESLIGKWYEFCQTKKSKAENIQSKISKLNKNSNKKSHFQEVTEKPDFRKVKSRRRKSQDFDQQGYPSQTRKLKASEKQAFQHKTQESSTTCQQEQTKPKQRDSISQGPHKQRGYAVQGPRQTHKGENIYSKFGYVNMNISEEFTDSLILKELEEKNVQKIKQIKEKARGERKVIKTMVEQADNETAGIIRL